jgi:hypothetical protein
MNSRTVSVVVDAPKERVFSFLSDVKNLPKWATEFCRELRTVGGKYKVVTCDPSKGEIFFKIRADEPTGVIDMYAGPTEDQMGIFPTRVVELPNGASAYVFTMFQAPDMSDDLFNAQYESLKREFRNIENELSLS